MKDRLNIQLIVAAILAIGGLILLFCGIYIEPQGQIHETLLVAFGEVMTFSGSLMGIDYHYKSKDKYETDSHPPQHSRQSRQRSNSLPVQGSDRDRQDT